MATLALAAAGAAAGGALLPAGISVLGATLTGAAVGSQAGALAGSFVDHALFGSSGQTRTFQGPRLADLQVTASTEGADIPRIYGRVRLGGQIIWATPHDEQTVTTTQRDSGGKGRPSGGSSGGGTVTQIEYRYYGNFAVALAEGPIAGLGRVWADGSELDMTGVTHRLYLGDDDQEPDSLIVAKEGAGNSPAYRGIAYVVFEHLPLAKFGNRLPQLSFETYRSVDQLHSVIRGVVVIPGSGEFAYATDPVTRLGSGGVRVYENVHTLQGGSDWKIGIDQLEAALPAARSASLVVSWFGSDLRAGECRIRPGVELSDKDNVPLSWSVAGLDRRSAYVVSQRENKPAYGGTPSDQTVVGAIRDLRARGMEVTLTPFVLMDIPAGNSLSNPFDGSARQPAYPWRGRICVDPAPGRPGSPDQTASAAIQIARLVGAAQPNDFTLDGDTVIYSGPDEWSLRRQILHYAWLAKAAGGVDAFVIGSEFVGLTTTRSAPGSYPFVAALISLAADVKSVCGAGTEVTYAADWTEYFGHQPADGSGDVYFHLDPLWSAASIDAVGIDLYWPLADWRDGEANVDALTGARSIYDLAYLMSNINGGEGFDWYYPSLAARLAQLRTPITDGAGKPWVFRPKDLTAWWSNPHYDRPAGIESSSPTAWTPRGKPVWFMEVGCPAVDHGANQPNAFIDPKSAESTLPYFSVGRRDDFMQRRYLQALLEAFDPGQPRAIAGLNPTSPVYGGSMVDIGKIHVYAWDARPYPAFPNDVASWGDGENWHRGHWLNGRIASAPLADVVSTLLDDYGFADYDTTRLEGVVDGYAIDRIMSAREALQPIELAFFIDSLESNGLIAFRHRGADPAVAILTEDDLVDQPRASSPLLLTRAQETELPVAAKLAYSSSGNDYRRAISEARRLAVGSGRIAKADLAIVLEAEVANAMAETWLFEAWASRERASLTLAPSGLAMEPGDIVSIASGDRHRLFRITEITERGERQVQALSIDPSVYMAAAWVRRTVQVPSAPAAGQPLVEFLDLPMLRGDEPERSGYVAAAQSPWPGGLALFSSPELAGYELKAMITAPATMGRTLTVLASGPTSRSDQFATVRVQLDGGQLSSATRLQLLSGANTAALRTTSQSWEVIQFQTATLVGTLTYELTGFLRGQAGTEALVAPVEAGARFVLLDAAVTRVDLGPSEVGLPLSWRCGPAGRDLGEESYVQAQYAFAGLAQRPFSPVRVLAHRESGNILMGWIRRTRIGGDSWDSAEVPLGEESETYEVDILASGQVVRTLTTSSPAATYTQAQQIADFGVQPSSIRLRVYQTNHVWGRSIAAEVTV